MSVRSKRFLWTWIGAAAMATAAVGVIVPSLSGDDAKVEVTETPVKTFIGELAGAPDSARIAFVVEAGKFVAYVCSGDEPFNDKFSRWFRGDIRDGKLSAATQCEAKLNATLSGDTLTGNLTKEGKTHEFTAKVLAGDANAGLFRAGETFGEDDYTVGWIVDEKENIVGTGGKRGGKVQTPQPPKGTENLAAQIGDKKVEAGKVIGAGTGANANNTGKKIDAALKAELLQDLVEQRKATGGNPIQAMLLHQIKRFTAGKKPETKIEEKVFAALITAPRTHLPTTRKIGKRSRKPPARHCSGPRRRNSIQTKAWMTR